MVLSRFPWNRVPRGVGKSPQRLRPGADAKSPWAIVDPEVAHGFQRFSASSEHNSRDGL